MKIHLTFFLVTFAACAAHIGGRPPASQDLDPHFYCVRKLAKMLATICDYNVKKRSDSGSVLHPILASHYKAEEYGWPYVTSQKHKNQEPYNWPHKMDPQTDWPQKSEPQYIWPLTGSYGLLSHKAKESNDWGDRESQDAADWPWLMTAHNARGLDLTTSSKRYVLSECCEKPCTMDELITYC